MSPALESGDYVILKRSGALRPGRVYVVDHIDLGIIIKRLKEITDLGAIFTGDNLKSTPQSLIAPLDPQRVIGQAAWRISPRGIKRL